MALTYAVQRRTPLAAPRPAPVDYAQRLLNSYISQYLRTDSRPAKVLCL